MTKAELEKLRELAAKANAPGNEYTLLYELQFERELTNRFSAMADMLEEAARIMQGSLSGAAPGEKWAWLEKWHGTGAAQSAKEQ